MDMALLALICGWCVIGPGVVVYLGIKALRCAVRHE